MSGNKQTRFDRAVAQLNPTQKRAAAVLGTARVEDALREEEAEEAAQYALLFPVAKMLFQKREIFQFGELRSRRAPNSPRY